MSIITDENADIAAAIEATIAKLNLVKQEIGKVIFGQEGVVQDTLITVLAGGHVLLVGVPGLAKTRLAETLGVVLGLAQKRVQFTPDLMPADILGSEVLDDAGTGRQSFRFIPGPIFAQLLMADEERMATRQERDQRILNDAFLAEDDPADLLLDLVELGDRGFDRGGNV